MPDILQMPPINTTDFDVICECGAVYHTSEQHIGNYIQCVRLGCSRRVPIRRRNAAALECSPVTGSAGPFQPSTPQKPRTESIVSPGSPNLLRLIPFPWKVISTLVVLACALAVANLWIYHSKHLTLPPPSSEAQRSTVGESGSLPVAPVELPASDVEFDPPSAPKETTAPPWKDYAKPGTAPSTAKPARASLHASSDLPPVPKGYSLVDDEAPTASSDRTSTLPAVARKRQAVDARPTTYNSLPSGTRIAPDIGTDGHGELTVNNGTSEDAVVRLYDASTLQDSRWFWVQAGHSAQMIQLPEGVYALAYTTGLDWLDSEDSFRWHPSYNEFGRKLEYSERRDSEGIHYHDISVTLNPVIGGNVRTRVITREEFLKGHHHMPLQK
jgi:hypothetical protein